MKTITRALIITQTCALIALSARAQTNTNAPCTITCSTNIVVCNDPGKCGAVVQFAAPAGTNCSGLTLGCVPVSGSFFPVGTNPVICAAMNSAGNVSNMCSFEVVVHDCEPPVIHSAAASPDVLWPPNHRMVHVTLQVVATDNCGIAETKIVSVTSNESVNAHGSGHTHPDWQITGDLTVLLRAERAGPGDGRIYTITVEATDTSGNSATAEVEVTVPHDQGHHQGHHNHGHHN